MKKSLTRIMAAMLIVVLTSALAVAAGQDAARAKVDISGHPFKGPVNAPVTVVVFSDYL
jgi:protein-disulfide isomerase